MTNDFALGMGTMTTTLSRLSNTAVSTLLLKILSLNSSLVTTHSTTAPWGMGRTGRGNHRFPLLLMEPMWIKILC